MSGSIEYEKTHRSTVNRLKKRAVYDQASIHAIIDSTPVVHVSFVPVSLEEDPFPAVLPMLGCTGTFSPGALDSDPESAPSIYLHGYISSRLMRLPSSNLDESLPGTPVCIAATHIDGIVLALTPFHHSSNYRSAIIHGWAHIVTDPQEKLYAMERITNNIVSERWGNTRVPPTKAELESTGILRVEIVSASAKVRNGGPADDRVDLNDKDLRERVWTGVVPTWRTYGEPVPAEVNGAPLVPRHIQDWVKKENAMNEKLAKQAVLGKGEI